MQEKHIEVPVLVLSGEGNQPETIKAIRLGARDYVRKDDVEKDLLARISALTAEEQEHAAAYLLHQAPAPIAVALKRYRAALEPVRRLRRLLELHEAVLRFTALLGLAELRGRSLPLNLSQLSIGSLAAPAMGTWNGVRLTLLKALGGDGSFGRYANAIDTRLLERAVKVRNDLAHGGEPSGRVAADLLDELEGGTQQMLGRLRRAGGRFAIVTSLDFDGRHFEVEAAMLVGDSIALPTGRVSSPTAVVRHHAYALDNSGETWTDLFPLIAATPSREPSAWRVFVFDGIQGGHPNAALRGREPLRYIDIWSSERGLTLDEHPTADNLRGVTADW
jgi:hypothetical protein